MSAARPDRTGTVERDGVETSYDVFGADHATTVLLLPTWSIVHSRHWKAQVPVLARRHRVITIDGRGNGRSGRPRGVDAYLPDEFVADTLAVLDATSTERAVVAGVSFGGWLAFLLAARHPQRIAGACFIGAAVPFPDAEIPPMLLADFDTERDTYEAWEMHNRHSWEQDYRRYLEFFFSQSLVEAHSTKEFEDCVGWGLDTTPEVLADTRDAQIAGILPLVGQPIDDLCDAIQCPTLHIHGDTDMITPHAWAVRLADTLGSPLVTVEGGGHLLQAREPVLVNDLLRTFVDDIFPPPPRRTTWTRALRRPRRALYVSSPIGLGHAQRDIAIAQRAPRARNPTWRSSGSRNIPVTTALAARAARRSIPPSALLASESAHIESESHEHDLHAFQAIRNMDDLLVVELLRLRRAPRGRALRPRDRGRGMGPRLLPPREPRTEALFVRVDDRLRRAGCRSPTTRRRCASPPTTTPR